MSANDSAPDPDVERIVDRWHDEGCKCGWGGKDCSVARAMRCAVEAGRELGARKEREWMLSAIGKANPGDGVRQLMIAAIRARSEGGQDLADSRFALFGGRGGGK